MHVETYLDALAGLLHDPRFTEDWIISAIPKPWIQGVHERWKKADWLSWLAQLAAGQRENLPKHSQPPRQLRSVFCTVKAEDQHAPKPLYLPLMALELSESVIFPGEAWAEKRVVTASQVLWKDFEEAAVSLGRAYDEASDEALPLFVESLLLLMQRYFWCVPCGTPDLPATGLYDQSRVTAALAAIQGGQVKNEPSKPVARLVGGDLSGVQDFIYTITSRGAASALRGRSFYLQLLSEAIIRLVLRQLELPITNLLYSGGGNFYLLARSSDEERLVIIQQEISRHLLRFHHGDLYLALASVPLQPEDFLGGGIGERWRSLAGELRTAKQRRFTELGEDMVEVFKPQGSGGSQERQCQVCGVEHANTRVFDATEENPEGVRKCPVCVSYEELGDNLRQAEYLVLDLFEPRTETVSGQPTVSGGYEDALAPFGLRAWLKEGDGDLRFLPEVDGRLLLALSDMALEKLEPQPGTAIGRRFLVNVTPILQKDEIKTLEKDGVKELPYAGSVKPFDVLERQSQGIKRLGVLRMDADNLGRLFAEGLGAKGSLASVTGLSFAISLFFEGWVNALGRLRNEQNRREKPAEWGERLYSIYSGGDDLFFVGAWDEVTELARQIRADLGRYVAGHPGLHASAGIALVGGRYPLYQAAADAGRAEDQAKSLQWVDSEGKSRRKDAITFLGQALPWERFGTELCTSSSAQTVHGLMHRLAALSYTSEGGSGVPQALLSHLIWANGQYHQEAERRRKTAADRNQFGEEQVLYGPWIWRTYYTLSRMAARERSDEELRTGLEELRDLLKRNFRAVEWIGLAARWAELLLR